MSSPIALLRDIGNREDEAVEAVIVGYRKRGEFYYAWHAPDSDTKIALVAKLTALVNDDYIRSLEDEGVDVDPEIA